MGIANPHKLGEGKASGFVRDAFGFGHTRMPKLNCSSGSSDACLAARVAPEECLLLSPHYFVLKCVAVMFVRLIA